MKAKAIVAALVCCFGLGALQQANARSWRVNNNSQAKADFADLNAAMQKVSEGDTIYLDKGAVINGDQTINKSVTVIGPGYFIGENGADEARIAYLYIEADDAKITGVRCTSEIYVRAMGVVIERCHINSISAGSDYECDEASIRSCFITGTITGGGDNSGYGWQILNNIFVSQGDWTEALVNLTDAVISHNAITSKRYQNSFVKEIRGSVFTDNIVINNAWNEYQPYDFDANCTVSHNIFCNSGYYANNIYLNSRVLETVYAGQGDIVSEDFFQLAANSPAKGYAEDGGDCGPWDGPFPYVKHGYPLHIPRFESLTVPSKPDSEGKLKVSLKVVNQNE